jgi:hypothetical protein
MDYTIFTYSSIKQIGAVDVLFMFRDEILTKAENPCSATGAGSAILSFLTRGGLTACLEFVNNRSVVLSIRIITDTWSTSDLDKFFI